MTSLKCDSKIQKMNFLDINKFNISRKKYVNKIKNTKIKFFDLKSKQ